MLSSPVVKLTPWTKNGLPWTSTASVLWLHVSSFSHSPVEGGACVFCQFWRESDNEPLSNPRCTHQNADARELAVVAAELKHVAWRVQVERIPQNRIPYT